MPKLLTVPYQVELIEQANYIGNIGNNCIYDIGTKSLTDMRFNE